MTRDVRWLVRSPGLPDSVVPARDEDHARELVRKYRALTIAYHQRVAWEYGTHVPGTPNSYRKMSR